MMSQSLSRFIAPSTASVLERLHSATVKVSFSRSLLQQCSVFAPSRRCFSSLPSTVPGHGSPAPGTGSTAHRSSPAAPPSHARLPGVEVDDIDIGLYDSSGKWADFRPVENFEEVTVTRNAAGDLEGKYQGVDCIFPDQETTLEWVLSTPVDVHLFEEQPFVKDSPDYEMKEEELKNGLAADEENKEKAKA